MSDNEAIEEINKALEKELEGIDYEAIANSRLRNLDKEYNTTIAANIIIETPKEGFNDPGWEADFTNQGYEQCPSDEEEATDEIPINYTRDLYLPQENIEKIKKIMSSIKIKPPHWAKNIPDQIFTEHLKLKILK